VCDYTFHPKIAENNAKGIFGPRYDLLTYPPPTHN
jgi:hypothetical protein